MDYKSKWNKYKDLIGKRWMGKNRHRLCKKKFIEYVLSNNIKHILEIGSGDLFEATSILDHNHSISYHVVNISDVF